MLIVPIAWASRAMTLRRHWHKDGLPIGELIGGFYPDEMKGIIDITHE